MLRSTKAVPRDRLCPCEPSGNRPWKSARAVAGFGVFGDLPADDPRALEAIAETLNVVFAGALNDETAAYLEDGHQLVPILHAQRARHPGMHLTDVVIDRVRFSTPVAASVGFQLVINDGAGTGSPGS